MKKLLPVSFALLFSGLTAIAQPPPPPAPDEGAPTDAPLPNDGPDFGPQERTAPPPPQPRNPLTDADKKAALDFLRQDTPAIADFVQALEKKATRDYERQVRRALKDMRDLERIQRDDPTRAEDVRQEKRLERQSWFLSQQYRDPAASENKEAIRRDLEQLLLKLFDIREQRRQEDVARLEKRLEEMRQLLKKRAEKKAEIVEQRLQELLGEKDDELRW